MDSSSTKFAYIVILGRYNLFYGLTKSYNYTQARVQELIVDFPFHLGMKDKTHTHIVFLNRNKTFNYVSKGV